MPPHIFKTADEAYVNLLDDLLPRSITLKGDSSAGKTESFKYCALYLLTVAAQKAALKSNAPMHTLPAFKRGNGSPADVDRAKSEALERRGPLGWALNQFTTNHLRKVR